MNRLLPIALAAVTMAPVALAQLGSQGLGGVGGGGLGGQGGRFTIPRVEAHTVGIPGVSRPMLMGGLGAVGGGLGGGFGGAGGMGGGGGVGGGLQPNPNWVGAAAMFMPQLLTGQGGANAGVGANNPAGGGGQAGRPFGAIQNPAETTVAQGQAHRPSGPTPVAAVAVARVGPSTAPVDAAEADARLLAFQQRQAKSGSPSAQYALARRYLKGDGVEANRAVARVWLEAAAKGGSGEASAELAAMER